MLKHLLLGISIGTTPATAGYVLKQQVGGNTTSWKYEKTTYKDGNKFREETSRNGMITSLQIYRYDLGKYYMFNPERSEMGILSLPKTLPGEAVKQIAVTLAMKTAFEGKDKTVHEGRSKVNGIACEKFATFAPDGRKVMTSCNITPTGNPNYSLIHEMKVLNPVFVGQFPRPQGEPIFIARGTEEADEQVLSFEEKVLPAELFEPPQAKVTLQR